MPRPYAAKTLQNVHSVLRNNPSHRCNAPGSMLGVVRPPPIFHPPMAAALPQGKPMTESSDGQLFSPTRLGAIDVANRVAMAPLTRNRAIHDRIPNPLAIQYYEQRASAGLIIAEATQISPMGQGYLDTPGIYSQAQIDAWKKVT